MLIYYLQMLDTPEEKMRFEQIYLKYRGLMYRVADSILHNRQDAEDAVHNAFLRIIKHFKKFQTTPVEDLAPQVVVIARNEAISLLRKRKGDAPLEDWDGLAASSESVSDYHALHPPTPDVPGRHGDETAAGLLRRGDRRQAGPVQNGGEHPDQPGPPAPAGHRGAGGLLVGGVGSPTL